MQAVGRSEYTRIKQEHLEYILDVHFSISKAVSTKYRWANNKIFYADIFAGDGGEENLSGSPVVFERICKRHRLDCDPIFIEENPVTVKRLEGKIVSGVINARNEDILPAVTPLKNQFGLLYVDPNGDPPFSLLERFFQNQNTEKIDLLIYFSGTTIKRALNAPNAKRVITLKDNLRSLPKKHWIIRSTFGKFQWSFLLGTNWIDFPTFKKIGFYKTDSEKGQHILNQVNHTAKELKQLNIQKPIRQLSLFQEVI